MSVTTIPNYVTLVIPTTLTLTFSNNINNAGIIDNNGTIAVGTLLNSGTYKGRGSCLGHMDNTGTIQIGGN